LNRDSETLNSGSEIDLDESDFLDLFRKRDFSVVDCLLRKMRFFDALLRFFSEVHLRIF
jgi:hypothetical protein